LIKESSNSLKVENLSVFRSELPLFEAISFELNAGDAIQIGGTNGSGKTSFLRCLCDLSRRYEGNIWWNNDDISEHAESYYAQILYIGHSLGLKPKLTVQQNLSFYQELRFDKNELVIEKALNQLKIGAYFDEMVGNLSAGQKRRVALARILCEPVDLWILDEPMVALDREGQSWLENACNRHLDSGGMIVLTSHQAIEGINGLKMLELQDANLDIPQLVGEN